jgi:hypothetical protein
LFKGFVIPLTAPISGNASGIASDYPGIIGLSQE